MLGVIFQVDDRQVVAHLEALPAKLRTGLKESITRLTDQMLQRVRAAEPYRTGKLRQETQAFVDEHEEGKITGAVRILGAHGRGHNVAAAALEYGAHRIVNVQAHREHLNHVFNRATDSQFVAVRAYQRRANIQAKRFLRDPAQAMRPRIQAELERVISETVKE
jgi:hypothetical protein